MRQMLIDIAKIVGAMALVAGCLWLRVALWGWMFPDQIRELPDGRILKLDEKRDKKE